MSDDDQDGMGSGGLEWYHCDECDASFLREESLIAHSHVHK